MKANLRSMTAFAETMFPSSMGLFILEIQSVNRRFLEVNLNLPKGFSSFESEMRQWVQENVGRGQINVNIFWKERGEHLHVLPNLPLVKEIKKGWDLIAKELNLPYEFSLDLLANEKNIFIYDEKLDNFSSLLNPLKEVFMNLLLKFRKMKEEEGMRLLKDIMMRVGVIEKAMEKIELASKDDVALQREKYQKKIEELFGGNVEERVFKEAALLAEKIDITEEIVRFKSHLTEFKITIEKELQNNNDTKGKKLDFLLQELHREINTLGMKSVNVAIAKLVVEIKVELEKIREQVQNIE